MFPSLCEEGEEAGNKPKMRSFPLGFLKPLYVSTSLCKKVNLGN